VHDSKLFIEAGNSGVLSFNSSFNNNNKPKESFCKKHFPSLMFARFGQKNASNGVYQTLTDELIKRKNTNGTPCSSFGS
jgi:hypothetical protein